MGGNTLLVLLFLLYSVNAFYLPGLAPVNYCTKSKETEGCKVNDITANILNHYIKIFFSQLMTNNNFFFIPKSAIAVFVNRLNSEEAIIPFEYEQ